MNKNYANDRYLCMCWRMLNSRALNMAGANSCLLRPDERC